MAFLVNKPGKQVSYLGLTHSAAAADVLHGIPFPDPFRSLRKSPLLVATGNAGKSLSHRCPPLSLPFASFCSHRCHLHRPHCQAPSVLSPPHLPSFLQPPLPLLLKPINKPFSSSADSDSDSDHSISSPLLNSKDADKICKIIDDIFSSDRNMETVLTELGLQIEPALVIAVLDRFRHAHRPAYRFFRWAATVPGFSHDPATCNKMLDILGKTRQFETMAALLDEMGNDALLSMDAFMICIKSFAAARDLKKCVAIFKLIERHDFHPGLDTFNCLIDALSKAKLAKEAQQLIHKMQDQFSPNLHTYTALLHGFCKIKNLIEAGRIWNQILDSGFKPDIITHNTMIQGLIQGNRRSDAIKLLELMKAKGPNPNSRTYNILIQDFCNSGMMEEAVTFFGEMEANSCTPDVVTYTCLIVGFGKARQMSKVSALLMEMREKGCPPDAQTYTALIKLMTSNKMLDEAVRLYQKMVKSGFEPTLHTYNMLMKAYFVGENYSMGCAIWDEMTRKGICPDVNSYTVFINGHIRHGRPEEAYKKIEEMICKGMGVPQVDYNKFVADFSKFSKPDALDELAEKVSLGGKFDAARVLSCWSERMKKRVRR